LPTADKSTMNFGSGGGTHKKAWKDIWGAGQGVGAIHDIPDVATLVDRIEAEYLAAKAKLCAA
jgi:nitronate monooxygenase